MALADIALSLLEGIGLRREESNPVHTPGPRPYAVMHGVGNRFVIVDNRAHGQLISEALRMLREKLSSHAYDQLIVLERSEKANAFMRIINMDGSEVSACGNASRCVAWLLMQAANTKRVTIMTKAGLLRAERAGDHFVTVDMGPPRFVHADIPVVEGTPRTDLSLEGMERGVVLGMGNPHVVFFVADAEAVDLAEIGPKIENRTDIFPERVNVSVAQLKNPEYFLVRTWERGAGLTQACGTAACAAVVAAAERGIGSREVDVEMPGGLLRIEWRMDDHVWMTGPVEEESRGEVVL